MTTDALAVIKRASTLLCLATVLACSQGTPPREPAASSVDVHQEQPGTDPSPTDAAIYYVAADGSDRNSGLSPTAPWKTISKVNATDFEPGDTVCFQRGDTWREQLTVSASGEADRPIQYGAYGQGPNPRISGTVRSTPGRNAIRNANFEEFIGLPDDGIEDAFLHFSNGSRVEAVSAPPEDGGDVAVKLTAGDARAYLYGYVYLPAATAVSLRWKAASFGTDGDVAIRHRLKSARAEYLQDDLQSWGPEENWTACPLAGSTDGIWHSRSMDFITDTTPGVYQIYFLSGRSVTADAGSYLDELQLELQWVAHSSNVFVLGTGYEPGRVLIQDGPEWTLALNGKDFDRTVATLDDRMWIYDTDSGMLYFRNDMGSPSAGGIVLEISVPEKEGQGECGIYVDQEYVVIENLTVMGWPDDPPSFEYASGMALTENARGIRVSQCRLVFNYRVGILSRSRDSFYTFNTFAYNGGNGFVLANPGRGNVIAHNEAGYNGYWGAVSDDGEGIALGSGSAENLVESNRIHHNNHRPRSLNPGGLVVYHSNRNVIRYNRVYSNYKAGVIIDGAENQFYYNLVYANGRGYANTEADVMCNLMVRNYSPDGPGGNEVYNNVFFGGTSDTRWMGNLFVNRHCTGTKIRNNVFWGFINPGYNAVQIRVDGGIDLTATEFSHNVVGPEGPGFIHFSGNDYPTLSAYRDGTGQGAGSLALAPAFADAGGTDFRPSDLSPLVDAGIDVGLAGDFESTPLNNLPDIGAFEYQPF